MTLDDLGNIGEFVGAIGVVLSLVYLATQIRQNNRNLAENTKALRLSEEGTNQENFSHFRRLVIGDSEVATLAANGLARPSSLEPNDRLRFNLLMEDLFFALQLLYQRVQASVIPDCRWANNRSQIEAVREMPGFLEWWSDAQGRFDQDFRSEVESIMSQRETTTSGSAGRTPIHNS